MFSFIKVVVVMLCLYNNKILTTTVLEPVVISPKCRNQVHYNPFGSNILVT